MMERVGAVKQQVLTPLISETEEVRLLSGRRDKEKRKERRNSAQSRPAAAAI